MVSVRTWAGPVIVTTFGTASEAARPDGAGAALALARGRSRSTKLSIAPRARGMDRSKRRGLMAALQSLPASAGLADRVTSKATTTPRDPEETSNVVSASSRL
jgi:hypothetical protein